MIFHKTSTGFNLLHDDINVLSQKSVTLPVDLCDDFLRLLLF